VHTRATVWSEVEKDADPAMLEIRCGPGGTGRGACQGRNCERDVAELAGNLLGEPLSEPPVEPAACEFVAKDCG
jgi:hypothetical protein